ncbi:LysM peptidoglycan-binding domain-containing protein [Bacillus subtilis]|uniref:LysM peptidoglycan-binding domain-containing protein n=2 Tax=Bacillus subtilis TaxID=1423 RepID=UPI0007E2DDD1|nr:LysM peptidoglycan-binding domain-containing protein [Bacillus subtilis]MBO3764924.1 LysM peptidoglycan-binding domain-containing protein [Bacillus subtilis]ODV45212.1 stage VI sporulation protein D [Bacillus subtilis]OJH63901.1 stage VI sporulation protein D [Bacillus subtilis]
MPQNHRLQFSVEESICFQKGQEVSELLSISLDPDIRVQEVNDYVSIIGSLELTGEYNIDQNKHTEEIYTDKRFVEQVRKREDGSAELTHCFPVDITIPKNKVSHLQDVFVFIDAFDYQLTDSRILTIQADLAIEGLLDDTQDKEPEIPLYEAPAAFREEELSEPPAHSVVEEPGASSAEEAVLQHEPPAEPPELFISKAGLREELETEKAESEPPESVASEPEAREDVKEEEESEELAVPEKEVRAESVASEPEAREDVKEEEESEELAVPEKEVRAESETEESEPEPDPLEIEIQEIVKAKKETAEPAAAIADVREEADSPAETELREHAGAEESPALEAELHSETVIAEEKAETTVSPNHEYALRQEAQNEEAAQSDQADPALCQEEAEPDEALENVSEAALSVEDSRETASAVYVENDKADFHFHQKTSSEEASQEELPEPAYRTFLPEQEEEDSFYSAPKLLEEEEQEEESFEIEVRKTPSAEEPKEETPFQSFQLSESSETERKETDAVPRVAPAAETKEPQTKESDNSLYLTKLFTKEADEFSRMKICIVQQEDTIERLCERYEITSQQLIRMNSLALDDELKAGQILYIPQYKNSHA